MNKARQIRKKFVFRLGAGLLVFFVLYLSYQAMVEKILLPMAKSRLESITGSSVEIGSVGYHPSGAVTINDLKIASSLEGSVMPAFLTAGQAEVVIPFSSILLFNPRLKSIVIHDFVTEVIYSPDLSSWNLHKLEIKADGDGSGDFPLIQLNNGVINVRILNEKKFKTVYTIELKKGAIAPLGDTKNCGFFFETNPSYSQIPSSFGGKWVRGRDGKIIVNSEYFSSGKAPILGNIIDTRNLELELQYSPEKISIEKFGWQMGEKSLVEISGNITEYKTKGNYDLKVNVKDTVLSRDSVADSLVYGCGLSDLTGDKFSGFLDRYSPDGMGDLDIQISGSMNDPSKIKFSGVVRPEDVSINYYKFPYKIDHLKGDIRLSEKGIKIEKLSGKHDDVDINIEGSTDFTSSGFDYDILIKSPNMLLGDDIYWALSKKQQSLWYTFTPRGRASIEYKLWRKGGQQRDSLLTVDMLNAEADYLHFPYHLENVTGRITISPEEVNFTNLVSGFDNRTVTLNGKVTDTKSANPQYNITINANNIPLDSRLKAALPYSQRSFYDSFEIYARADAEIKVFPNEVGRRPVEYIAKITVKDAKLLYEDFPLPLSKVSVDAVLTPDGTFLKELKGKNGDGEVLIKGTVWPIDEKNNEPGFCLSLDAENISIEGDWLKSLPPDVYNILQQLEPSGPINVKADMNHNSRVSCPEFMISVDCLGTSLVVPKFHYPIDNVFGTVVVRKDRIDLKDIRAISPASGDGPAKILLNGKIFTEKDQIERGEFSLSATDIPFDSKLEKAFEILGSDFYKKASPEGMFDINLRNAVFHNGSSKDKKIEYSGNIILKNCSFESGKTFEGMFVDFDSEGVYVVGTGLVEGRGSIQSPSMKIKKREINDFHVEIDYDPNTASFNGREFTAKCYEGNIFGDMSIKRILPKKFEYNIESSFVGVDLNGIVAAGKDPVEMANYTEGTVGGFFGVQGVFGDDKSRMGRLTLGVSGMEFAKRTLLGKIVTASQFSSPSDYIFSDMNAKAYVQGEKLLFENIEIFGSSMMLKGAGNSNIKSGGLNLNFNGFGRKAGTKLSFLETLFRGIGSGVVNTKITGTFDDPVIVTTTLPMIKKPFQILGTKE